MSATITITLSERDWTTISRLPGHLWWISCDWFRASKSLDALETKLRAAIAAEADRRAADV